MHKKLASELISIAHSILQMKNKEDVVALKSKAHAVYEKLSVLSFIDTYLETTPQASETKEELLEKVASATENNHPANDLKKTDTDLIDIEQKEKHKEEHKEKEIIVESAKAPKIAKTKTKPVSENNDLFSLSKNTKSPPKTTTTKTSLEEELKDTISLDVATEMFENVERIEPKKKSLNDSLFQNSLQIGLNDRIAFVKHLFNASQEDFNRVISQLNSFKTEKEAKKFFAKIVKPDYDWNGKEEYVERFIEIIERKFI